MRQYKESKPVEERKAFSLEEGVVLPPVPLSDISVRKKLHTRLHPDVVDQTKRVGIEERIPASDAADLLILIGLAVRARSTANTNLQELAMFHLKKTQRFLAEMEDE
jgi:hypothetical protein